MLREGEGGGNSAGNLFTRFMRWLFPAAEPEPVVEQLVEPIAVEPPEALVAAQPKVERKPYKPSIAPLRNAVEDAVTDLIEKIVNLKMANLYESEGAREYEDALSYLHGCDFHYISGDLADRMEGGSRIIHNFADPADAKDIQDISWPIDIATVHTSKTGSLFFSRMFSVTAAELRGKAKIFAPRMALLVDAVLRTDGTWFAQKHPVGLINGKWISLDNGLVRQASSRKEMITLVEGERRQELSDAAMLAQSLAITERYSWHVSLGRPGGPRICLPTNPLGCLELFKTREKRDNETRRAALRHWVQNHYRDIDDGEMAYVRDHLRGTTEFTWRDLDCEIFVSQFDLEKNEFFRQQAAEWRSQRKHNRVRVRIKRA